MKNYAETIEEHLNKAQSIIHVSIVAVATPQGAPNNHALETCLRIAQNELSDAYAALDKIIEPQPTV